MARTGRDWSGSLLKQVTLTAGWQERPKEATCRTLPEKEPAKQLQRKARLPAKIFSAQIATFLYLSVSDSEL